MRATIYTLAASAAMLVLALSMPFTAIVSAASPASAVSAPYPTEITPVPPTPEPAIPAEDPLPLDQNPQPQENQAAVAAAAAPTITVWETTGDLNFGQIGNPQPNININGNVFDPDNDITGLSSVLDGTKSIPVFYNPTANSPRLVRLGDFTIEIPTAGLSTGSHELVITANHSSGAPVKKTLNFNYTAGRTWTFPYSTNWSSATYINQRAQIVDGYWRFDNTAGYKGVRPQSGYTGYDRLIAIGDMGWSNYEVTVPITVWEKPSSGEGGVGIISNWKGHQQQRSPGSLPDDWRVMGAYAYYSFRSDTNRLAMWLNGSERRTANTTAFQMQLGQTYFFKLRVEKINGDGRYSIKAWKSGEQEPLFEDSKFAGVYNVVDNNNDQTEGSILINAHLVDATFGDVTISQLNTPIIPLNNKQFVPMIRK